MLRTFDRWFGAPNRAAEPFATNYYERQLSYAGSRQPGHLVAVTD